MRSFDNGSDTITIVRDDSTTVYISYDWGLQGPDGAWFILKPPKDATADDIKAAKSCLRRDHDVVSLKVERMK